MQTVVLASSNSGKIRELANMLAPFKMQVRLQSDWQLNALRETGFTFIENALLKARHASTHCQLPAIADDSGLIVPALQGAPGLHSARYAGDGATDDDNIQKLWRDIETVPHAQYQAYFYCVLVYLRFPHDPAPFIAEGKWHGQIIREKRGTNGFGYDPIFWLPKENRTAAELPSALKNKISHRGLAMQALISKLATCHESLEH